MMKRLGIVVTAAVFLAACGNGNSYDKAIDEVIEIENEALKKPGVKKDIDSLKREKACIRVFEEGKYIVIDYEIRTNDISSWVYKKDENSYNRDAGADDEVEELESVYVENEDLCQD
ncbi:cystatin-like fold lipoprotein [Bacillus sp. V2I10]|uniref:cystatin-like fold lipoprotein n=1 Tax=Bacillus sp. V2I10 TaxID=3042276 RepID=UPI00278879F5|nr:cystatin-like fold lipoprotein [Bacillus sp. V2I10]MDQ0862418.1 PBP1b-binding outer membrane lipoprotein LpoB [Bacillus sp. V2I10]